MLQFALLLYDPRKLIPSADDRLAGSRVIEALQRAEPPLMMLGSGYYDLRAGHPHVTSHIMGLADVFKSSEDEVKRRLLEDARSTIRSRKYKSIVMDRCMNFLPRELITEIHQNYRLERRFFGPDQGGLMRTRVGASNRPESLWVPQE